MRQVADSTLVVCPHLAVLTVAVLTVAVFTVAVFTVAVLTVAAGQGGIRVTAPAPVTATHLGDVGSLLMILPGNLPLALSLTLRILSALFALQCSTFGGGGSGCCLYVCIFSLSFRYRLTHNTHVVFKFRWWW